MKNFQEMWVLYFSKTLKNLAYAQLREVRTNQVISAHANFSRTHTKILGSVPQRKLIRDAVAKGQFSGYVHLPKNFSASPAAIFASPIGTEKLIKDEGLILVKLTRASIQDSKGCCTFQLSLVYNRVCWDFV
jgi:hypothetical protein